MGSSEEEKEEEEEEKDNSSSSSSSSSSSFSSIDEDEALIQENKHLILAHRTRGQGERAAPKRLIQDEKWTKDEEKDDGEDLDQEEEEDARRVRSKHSSPPPPSEDDIYGLSLMRRASSAAAALETPWMARKYAFHLQQVRDGLGHEGSRRERAQQVFDAIQDECLKGDHPATVDAKEGYDAECCLCFQKKTCFSTLTADNKIRFLGSACVLVAKGAVEFFNAVYSAFTDKDMDAAVAVRRMNNGMQVLLKGHAAKNDPMWRRRQEGK
jgi:hypothetical protein